jgi:hypothetical protein
MIKVIIRLLFRFFCIKVKTFFEMEFKIRPFKFLYFVLLAGMIFLLAGCAFDFSPTVSFDAPFPLPKKDLTKVLGNRFTVYTQKDTMSYTIQYDASNGYHLFIDLDNSENILKIRAGMYKDLCFMSIKADDSTYYIFAIKVGNQKIKGFGKCVGEQLDKLDEEIEKGNFKHLIKTVTTDTLTEVISNDSLTFKKHYQLHPHKKSLYPFYKAMIDTMPTFSIIIEK